jgi:predicted nuclease with RNAse H fold
MGRASGTAVGVDLSGLSRATKGVTAAACLTVTEPPELVDLATFRSGPESDATLADWVLRRGPEVVAIDAPLSLPHSVTCVTADRPRCLPGAANYLARDVDREAGGMPSVMLAAIMFRGIYLARHLRDHGLLVIETYPRAAYRGWGVGSAAGVSSETVLAGMVGSYRAKLSDERDAIAAGLAGVSYLQGDAHAIGGHDGVMWIPGSAVRGTSAVG